MNKYQVNKVRMFGAVDLVLDLHSHLFSQMADLVLAHQRLKSGLVILGYNREVQETDNSGLTDSKTDVRAVVVRQTVKVAAAVKSYALTVKNKELWKKANYTRSELLQTSDSNLFDIGTVILKLAMPIQAELGKYLFGDGKVTVYGELLAAFNAAIPQKRVADSVSKVSTLNIGEQIDSLSKLLKEEIDVLTLLYEESQPDFYKAFKNARTIVNYSGGGKAKSGESTEGGSPAV